MSAQNRKIIVVAHDMRSAHNVGSLLRTAEGLNIAGVYLTGYTPHPAFVGDGRLPHIANKQTKLIQKTALGAEASQHWVYRQDVELLLKELKADGYNILALEQSEKSQILMEARIPDKLVILLGREVEGIDPVLYSFCDHIVEIPMLGAKESFNVVQAAAMALYHCRFIE